MNSKLHFLGSPFSHFPQNYCEESGERFHQDLKEIGQRPGICDVNMMTDSSWLLKTDTEGKRS